jgi:hypothetical protein
MGQWYAIIGTCGWWLSPSWTGMTDFLTDAADLLSYSACSSRVPSDETHKVDLYPKPSRFSSHLGNQKSSKKDEVPHNCCH